MKYQVNLTPDPSNTKPVPVKGIHVISLPFMEKGSKELTSKFEVFLNKLEEEISIQVDTLLTGELNQYNYQLFKHLQEEAIQLAKAHEKRFFEQIKTLLINQKNQGKIYTISQILKEESDIYEQYIDKYYNENADFKIMVELIASDRSGHICNMVQKDKTEVLGIHERLDLIIMYIKKECALVLNLRSQGYDSIFYAGKMNMATLHAAKMDCPELVEAHKHKLNTYSATYKPVASKTVTPNRKIKSDLQERNNSFALCSQAFFNSAAIPLEEKIMTYLKLAENKLSLNENALQIPEAGMETERVLNQPLNS